MRLFVAFELPEDVRYELDRRCRAARSRLPSARWVRPEALHLTLVFLGDTDESLLPRLATELERAFAATPPLELTVAEPGSFPPRGRKRVVWVGVEADGDLGGLQGRVAEAVEEAVGLEPDRRPFHPHVTLARCKPPWPKASADALAEAFGPQPAGVFTARRGSLVASRLGPSGARYRTLETFALGPGG